MYVYCSGGGSAVSLTVNGYVSVHLHLADPLLLSPGAEGGATEGVYTVGGVQLQPYHTLLLLADRETVRQGLLGLGACLSGSPVPGYADPGSALPLLPHLLALPPTHSLHDLAVRLSRDRRAWDQDLGEGEGVQALLWEVCICTPALMCTTLTVCVCRYMRRRRSSVTGASPV